MKIEDMISKNRADCSGCSACANICPKNCISMQRDAEGFLYPKINHELCITCGKCEKVCPALNFKPTLPDKLPEVFVAIYPDEKVRRHSSSGGVFTALSEIILNDGGIIYGAGFNENWRVVHTSAENLDELENLRGSKYVQSQIGDVYKRVKFELENNRRVLFSGTPCQCAGLKSFLGKDYDNLLTVDIICHGVPSPLLWENYIDYRAGGHDIARVNFRSKRFGWMNNHLELTFNDCGYYAKPDRQDLYLKNFWQSMIERPSCHECKFKFPNGKSDITLADAWGVHQFAPNFFDNRGTSLAIVHTAKGKNFLSKAKLAGQPINFDVLPQTNPSFITSVILDSKRQEFFTDLKNFPHLSITILQKYFRQPPQPVNGRNAFSEAVQKYGAILQHLAKLREKNLMIITPIKDANVLNKLTQDAVKNFNGAGIYILQAQDNGQATFIDALHPLIKMNVQINFENLRGLIENFHVTNIFLDNQIKFNAESIKFLESNGTTIKNFDIENFGGMLNASID